MKISQELRTMIEKQQKPAVRAESNSVSFKEKMSIQSGKLRFEQLTMLLTDIEAFGKRLAKSRNFKDLARFKGLIKRFVKEAVENGLAVENSRSFDLYGNSRTLSIVKELDEKLVQLTEELLDQEKPSIELLERIGEIKGLLINLYT
ncbi:YaaR family protein [Bacillus sonorensis]|uniref:YaaR family protein n=1 Tax=Bacillus sonorensis TaxID=119858 RepID=UPI00049582BA|nr:YaaR family protein [Bacillus sonorensis]MCY8088264.1 YaaR family protein [Bacillus sonorensis]MCY8406378.1 YaaR family protein [Bacillus sonorensis]MEC1591876.1 YaaR family protein [Bacillus sonorensis]